jgi:sulfatase maturation enzyme AslB (radical SAM superfamily)
LSIDGVDDAQNLRAPGTFPLIDRLLDRLRTRHRAFYERDCTIAIIATPLNIRYLADSVDYLLDKGARRISIAPSIVSDPRWRLERIGELEAQFERILASSVSYLRETGRVPVQLLQGEAESPSAARRNRPMCGLVHGRGVTVDVDGEAYGCRLFAESYQRIPSRSMERLRGMRMGGIDDPDFARRFASFSGAVREAGIFHRKEEKRSAYGLCRSCRFFAHCSICPACIARAAGNRDPNRVSDFCCAFNMVALGCRERFSGLRGPRRISLAPPGAVALRDWWKALAGGAVQTQQPRRARRTEAP